MPPRASRTLQGHLWHGARVSRRACLSSVWPSNRPGRRSQPAGSRRQKQDTCTGSWTSCLCFSPPPYPPQMTQGGYLRVWPTTPCWSHMTAHPCPSSPGPSVPLSTITCAPSCPPAPAGNGIRERGGRHSSRPSLLHLTILLFIVHKHFPFYVLLQYECYFFSRVMCLALTDLFGGVETEHAEGWRAATWRGVHVSLWSAIPAALRVFALYSALKIYNTVQKAMDRGKISDDNIKKHETRRIFRAIWQSLRLREGRVITQD
ncbi:hypothetical protein BJV78DRAFT_570561 [Lactifluus subvellereus]|nr:hypothetical protein BJV78DRAFT_570561 [Lactifluus subvellereus]